MTFSRSKPQNPKEHCSYISGFPEDLRIDYICDPNQPSLDKAQEMIEKFSIDTEKGNHNAGRIHRANNLTVLHDEDELLQHAENIDLLVIASPNYLHTPSLLQWGKHNLTILVEKPVAVSREQHDMLRDLMNKKETIARIWVAMEYRFMPAIAKMIQLLCVQ